MTTAPTIIPGVTVARANVPALGHKLPTGEQIYTDAETLQTMLAAAKAAGDVVRCREDHEDTLAARVGSVRNFRIEGDRLLADLEIFDSYPRKELLLELVEKTPELFGLSAYFKSEYRVLDGKAFARIQTLNAVDVVDRGAVTPTGLFSARLDSQPQSSPTPDMTPEEITALIQAEIQKALAPVLAELTANKKDDKAVAASEVAASAKAEVEKLRADVAALGVKFAAKPADDTPKEKSILEQYSELKGNERLAFYAKHKDAIWAAKSAA